MIGHTLDKDVSYNENVFVCKPKLRLWLEEAEDIFLVPLGFFILMIMLYVLSVLIDDSYTSGSLKGLTLIFMFFLIFSVAKFSSEYNTPRNITIERITCHIPTMFFEVKEKHSFNEGEAYQLGLSSEGEYNLSENIKGTIKELQSETHIDKKVAQFIMAQKGELVFVQTREGLTVTPYASEQFIGQICDTHKWRYVDGDDYNVYYENEHLEPKEVERGAGRATVIFYPPKTMCTSELLHLAK